MLCPLLLLGIVWVQTIPATADNQQQEDQKVQKFHLLFGPFPNNRIDFFIASTRTWLGSVMQMGRRRLRRDINFPSALLQAKWILRVEKQCKKQIDSYNR